jgi:nucleoside-diphosphate-sugar epimerase
VRILVTGGAGYIGGTLTRLARREGHEITVFDRAESLPDDVAALPAVRFVRGDVRDRELLGRAAAGAGAIVHLAAISGRPACDRDHDEARSVNIDGTRAVCAVAGDRPLIFASTSSVYGAVPCGLCTESTPAAPLSLYAATKLAAEALVRAAGGVCLRFATCYGLSPRMRLDLLVNHFVDVLLRERRLEVYEPEARRTFLHVSDAARAVLLVLASPGAFAAGVFNTGDEALNLTKHEVLDLICRHVPGAVVSYTSTQADPDRRDYAVSYARIRSAGYRTSVSLEDGIGELVRGLSAP